MLIGVALEHGWNSQGKVSRMHILKVVKSDVLTKSEKSISQVFSVNKPGCSHADSSSN